MTTGEPERTLFLYWGRRGGLVRFTLELAAAGLDEPKLSLFVSISSANERFSQFRTLGSALLPVTTFAHGAGALLAAWRVPLIRRQLRDWITRHRITTAVTLLPHVWSPLTDSVLSDLGVRTYTVVHDVDPHPGDRTARVIEWQHRNLDRADRLVTLSSTATDRLVEKLHVPRERILTLFHPAFAAAPTEALSTGQRLRVLFIGRIMPYKGLPLLIEAVELLRDRGIAIQLGVYGEGDIAAYRERLAAVGASVVNRWLSDGEIDAAVASHDVLALPYIEASQSGIAGLALGQGKPVVATPVGGLVEQVLQGPIGLMASSTTPDAFAEAIARLVQEPGLLQRLAENARQASEMRSMAAFVAALAADIVAHRP